MLDVRIEKVEWCFGESPGQRKSTIAWRGERRFAVSGQRSRSGIFARAMASLPSMPPGLLLFLRLYPVAREQRGEVVLVGHAGQALEHPLEVGEGVVAVAPDLLDEGVDHRAAPAGVGAADEHPVLHAQLRRPHRVLGVVVVELDLAVREARLEVRQLGAGVAQRLAQPAGGGDVCDDFRGGRRVF